MPKTSKKKTQKKAPAKDVCFWLSQISSQLERLILCHEKRLSGESYPDYDSKEDLKSREQ